MNEILNKCDELIELLKQDERIIKVNYLKNKIYENDKLKGLIDEYHKYEDNIYSNEFKNAKKALFNNKLFLEFKNLENEINYLILDINKKLSVIKEGE